MEFQKILWRVLVSAIITLKEILLFTEPWVTTNNGLVLLRTWGRTCLRYLLEEVDSPA